MKKTPHSLLLIMALLFYPLVGATASDTDFTDGTFSSYHQYYLLQKYSNLIKKTKRGFVLNNKNGSKEILDSSFDIHRYHKDSDYLVFVQYEDESEYYEIIDTKNGNLLRTDNKKGYSTFYSEPMPSPDGKYLFVSAKLDEYDLYKIEGAKLKKEKSFGTIMFYKAFWIGLKKIFFTYGKDEKFVIHYDENYQDWLKAEIKTEFKNIEDAELEEEIKESFKTVNELFSSKEKALKAVTDYGDAIRFIPKKFRYDDDVVKAAILWDARNLEYASPELRNDRTIVLAAVKNDYSSLSYASDRLKDDYEIAQIAAKQSPFGYYLISERLQNNAEIIRSVINKCSSVVMSEHEKPECSKIREQYTN
ncbi:MAG: DUF4116 domain-containing protein [Rickettsiales bacterium]|nr:DUF4116 domain-containing protein [Rickettsiales bacterium]